MKTYKISEKNFLYTFNNDTTFSIGIFINSLKISYNYYVLTSSANIENGQDKLIFYNIKKKKIIKEIEGYSFIKEPNGLALVNNKKFKNLICICKNDYEEPKNGILIITLLLNDKKLYLSFNNTFKFKPYCVCPIKLYDNENNNLFNEDINGFNTDYFLVGGFDLE